MAKLDDVATYKTLLGSVSVFVVAVVAFGAWLNNSMNSERELLKREVNLLFKEALADQAAAISKTITTESAELAKVIEASANAGGFALNGDFGSIWASLNGADDLEGFGLVKDPKVFSALVGAAKYEAFKLGAVEPIDFDNLYVRTDGENFKPLSEFLQSDN